MSYPDNLLGQVIDLAQERHKRLPDVHDRRLEAVRKAFEQALPQAQPVVGKKAKSRSGKKKK